MKGKQKATLSFYLGGIVLFITWYFSHRFYRSYDIDTNGIQELKSQIEKKLEYNIYFDLTKLKQNQDQYQKILAQIFNKYPHEIYFNQTQNMTVSTENLLVKIECGNGQTTFNENNFNEITFLSQQCDSDKVQKKELQELRRLILQVHGDINENEQSYYDKLIIYDIYFFNANTQQQQQLEDYKNTMTSHILKICGAFNIFKNNIRINYKNFVQGEFQELDNLVDKSYEALGNPYLEKKELKQNIINKKILFGQEQNRINYKAYEETQILMVFNENNENQILFKEDYDSYDLLILDQFAFLSIQDEDKQKNNYSILLNMLTNIVLQQFKMSEFNEISTTFSEIQFQPNLHQLSSYFHKREILQRYNSQQSQLKILQFYQDQPENFIFSEENSKQIDYWLQISRQLIKNENQKEEYVSLIQKQENLNELDTIGLIEAFTQEYTMGVYLPLLIPIVYPYILAIKNIIIKSKE